MTPPTQPVPYQHLVLQHPTAIWCKYPFFLLLEEVEMGHRAPEWSQRGLEVLVLPKATSYSWVPTDPHWLPPCTVCPGHQLWHV